MLILLFNGFLFFLESFASVQNRKASRAVFFKISLNMHWRRSWSGREKKPTDGRTFPGQVRASLGIPRYPRSRQAGPTFHVHAHRLWCHGHNFTLILPNVQYDQRNLKLRLHSIRTNPILCHPLWDKIMDSIQGEWHQPTSNPRTVCLADFGWAATATVHICFIPASNLCFPQQHISTLFCLFSSSLLSSSARSSLPYNTRAQVNYFLFSI